MAVVQVQKAVNNTGSNALVSVSATIAAGTTGNLLVVFASTTGGTANGDPIVISDNGSNSWSVELANTGPGVSQRISMFYAKNIIGSPTTVTATVGNSHTAKLTICVVEYSGCSTTAPLLTSNGTGSGTGTALDASLSVMGSVSTVSIGGAYINNTQGLTDEGGWTNDMNTTATALTFDVQELIQTGSADPTWTTSPSSIAWRTVAAAFQAAVPFIPPLPYVLKQAVKRAAHF